MSAEPRCRWTSGFGSDTKTCQNAATHEWHITAGVMSGWQPRCDAHAVKPSKPGEMLSGCSRVVRSLASVQSPETS